MSDTTPEPPEPATPQDPGFHGSAETPAAEPYDDGVEEPIEPVI